MRYNIGDILDNKGVKLLVIDGNKPNDQSIGTKQYRKLLAMDKKDNIKINKDSKRKYMFEKETKNGKAIKPYFIIGTSIMVKELDKNLDISLDNRTYNIMERDLEGFVKVGKLTKKEIKEKVKENYIKRGIISKDSKLEYVLPRSKFFNYLTYTLTDGEPAMDNYYYNKMFRLYSTKGVKYFSEDSDIHLLVGKKKDNQGNTIHLFSDDSNPLLTEDKWWDKTYKMRHISELLDLKNDKYFRDLDVL